MVIAWLANPMEPSIGRTYLFLPTAKEVWEAVCETYSDLENSSQIFDLKTRLRQSSQGEKTVIEYYNEMKGLWQELGLCYDDKWECKNDSLKYHKRMKSDRVYVLLAGLNRELNEVGGTILGRNPLPSLTQKGTYLQYVVFNASTISICPWIIDSGATDHMMGSSRLFHSYIRIAGNQKIKIADGSLSAIAGKGSIVISQTLTFQNILHVPNLSCNLISISKLTHDLKCIVKFSSNSCVLQNFDSGRTMAVLKSVEAFITLRKEVTYVDKPSNPTLYQTLIPETLSVPEWKKAVFKEMNALNKSGTWEIRPLPEGKCTVGCKWIFTMKLNSDGSLECFKARLVHGFTSKL
ncbi:hypothetical protein ZIOFF_075100 [Zingiber officinale]|uniref:Retrovirus-related Pol polyprotein from transposon TNT 1-94-like beta-barrel domain-containing protein n=1 Tax=Zingiber officinale TaxID=94328 RepID=A0A8J5BU69_ZINOF|nr:hypothetical protein ZIOFF_075100 [Zingiber officinale]